MACISSLGAQASPVRLDGIVFADSRGITSAPANLECRSHLNESRDVKQVWTKFPQGIMMFSDSLVNDWILATEGRKLKLRSLNLEIVRS